MSIHNVNNLSGQVMVPDLCNHMGEDFTQLLQMVLGLRSARQGPLLLAHLIKQCGLRMNALIVGLSLHIGDSVQIRSVGSGAGHGIMVKAQREDSQYSDGQNMNIHDNCSINPVRPQEGRKRIWKHSNSKIEKGNTSLASLYSVGLVADVHSLMYLQFNHTG